MCGITGLIDLSSEGTKEELLATVTRMRDTMVHRGPDDAGSWADPETGVALGFRRLAILDLTPTGHQPMASADGRFVIVFNGEIYNFAALRQELEKKGHSFRGGSDTEVMLTAFGEWGFEDAMPRFNGMFAFALWDRKDRCLYLCRDRLGIKPLYYGWMGDVFLFGSELKTLRAHPDFQGEIDRNALALYMRHNYIPTPYSIFQRVSKLRQGAYLRIELDDPHRDQQPEVYWSAGEIAARGVAELFQGSEEEARRALDDLVRESVRLRMIADVPLGAFLSGGVDSSTVVALMQAQSGIPVRTFSIGFHEDDYDEARYAREVARHLGTHHTELYLTTREAQEVIPRLPSLYDEPFADSSQIPTFLVSKLAREHVTVSLSGDGGDELFAGYNRYAYGARLWRLFGWMPLWTRRLGARGLTAVSPAAWGAIMKRAERLIPRLAGNPQSADKIQKIAEIMVMDTPEGMYEQLVSQWKQPEGVVLNSIEPLTALTDRARWPELPDFTRRMMYLDLVSYLPDDILVKVDRASMGISLEARVPFLDDHRVVEFAWKLPMSMKVKNGQTKWLLRQVLYQYVPEELIERPKMGFGVPIDSWLRSDLREWAESLLVEKRLCEEGFFNAGEIRLRWREHLGGRHNWQHALWTVLMFQAWLDSLR